MNKAMAAKTELHKDNSPLSPAETMKTLEKLPGEKPETVLYCALVGSSMNPTLGEQDLLEAIPYTDKPVRAGDVIFFFPPEEKKPFIHRVVRMTSQGIQTRGENSKVDDPWLLKPYHIVGRVAVAWRGQKRRKIAGGWTGRLAALLKRWERALDQSVCPLISPVYRSLARRGFVCGLLPTRLRLRVVLFQAGDRNHFKLLLGSRVVGRYDVRQGQWRIQRPFRLFIKEACLPENLSRSK